MTDLVVASLEAWDVVWRRNQHLVSRLLLSDPDLRVLFVEPPVDPTHAMSRGARPRRGLGLRSADPPGADGRLWLFQPTKWLPRRVDSRADDRLTSGVLRATRRLGMHDPLLWLNDPAAAQLLRKTGWPALYDITDDWLAADRPPREHARLVADESFLLEHCQQVVVCSPRLLETKHADRVTLIPNAVDADAYRGDLSRPDDLPAGKVVIYVGTLHRDRLDVDLCVDVARSLPDDAHFVLVGPVALDAPDQARLTESGAMLLGSRPHTAVPAYLKNADVLLVPHVVTAFTDSLDPIKLYEYLVAGRPVVSTPVAGFRDLPDSHVRGVPASAFVATVVEALGRDLPTVRSLTAPVTWEERASDMSSVLAALRPG